MKIKKLILLSLLCLLPACNGNIDSSENSSNISSEASSSGVSENLSSVTSEDSINSSSTNEQNHIINGVVSDTDGNKVKDIYVCISNETLAEPITSITNENGEYEFVDVEKGTYELSISFHNDVDIYLEYDSQVIEVNDNKEINIILTKISWGSAQ